MEHQDFEPNISRRVRNLERLLHLSLGGWLLTVGTVVIFSNLWRSEAQQTTTPPILRISELVVIDKQGVERVRIAGDLPDAIIGGQRIPRGQQAAGIVLYDGTGSERSGYVTFEPSGNVGLTLDSRKRQVASFIAAPEDASMIQLWSGDGLVELRSDTEGSRLTAAQDGKVVSQQPLIKKISESMCSAYRDARSRVSNERAMNDCQRRFASAVCRSCLSKK